MSGVELFMCLCGVYVFARVADPLLDAVNEWQARDD